MRLEPYRKVTTDRRKTFARLIVEMPISDLEEFDQWAGSKGYASRADAVRQVLAKSMSEEAASSA
ncbi:MAG: hypothetical protein EOS51_07290 [Mesorhizobium sp.]|uniref:hypothetical protein n=1 Tax=unclassified Mesorhizobium TaxID=325217 RepID=UPI000FE973DD|nr:MULTISPECIES: hypothetical protein [unclassified Mesorhizobium]RWC23436.1 MAG: hypothetical protein EOS51_07290 [Mesorhizobium sp.]TGU01279.1 hypothetical protein EN807_16500 [Mesorhizobium sp. M5C.F.Ca.ET.164.01.1.1]